MFSLLVFDKVGNQ